MAVALQRPEDHEWEVVRQNTDLTSKHLRAAMPNARVRRTTVQTFTSGVTAAVSFDHQSWNVGNLHSISINPTRLTASISGLYLIGGVVRWADNATGYRFLGIRQNGTTYVAKDARGSLATGFGLDQGVTTLYRLAKGEYVELLAGQASGGNLNILVDSPASPAFWMERLGSYENEGVA